MLTVITPAASHDLTTVAAVKAELAVSGSGDDAWLADTITRASATVRRWCNRVFAAETVRETYRLARPVPELLLSRLPVVTIASVTVDGAAYASGSYEADVDAGVLRRLTERGRYQCWDAATTVVQYDAGYVLPGEPGRTLPEDVERATILLVKAGWHARIRDPMQRSTSVDGVGADAFWTGAPTLTPDVVDLLEPHRLTVVG